MDERTEEMRNKVIEKVEDVICSLTEDGIEHNDLDDLGKLVDIHKDLKNEEYWEEKEEHYMRIRGYEDYDNDSYGRRGVKGTGRYSRYRGEEYGRGRSRDSRGRYRGHDMIDDMYDHYGRYNDRKEEYRRGGHYGAKDDSIESLEKTMKAVYELICVISEEADSPDEMEVITKYARKISEL